MERPAYVDEVEDSLQEFGVYVSGISGKKQHMDSYMTITEYGKLQDWWTLHAPDYGKDIWVSMAEYWAHPRPSVQTRDFSPAS